MPRARNASNHTPLIILLEQQDSECDVSFNTLVAIEQFIWQLFLPFLFPLVLLFRGRHFAINSGYIPASLKPKDVAAHLSVSIVMRILPSLAVCNLMLVGDCGTAATLLLFHVGSCAHFMIVTL